MSAHADGIRACFELGSPAKPSGRADVRFTIERNGSVSSARDAGKSTITDVAIVQCIHREVRRWKFPLAECGAADVVYPFLLGPD